MMQRMAYAFRIRFVLGERVRIKAESSELVRAQVDADGENVVLKPRDSDCNSLSDAQVLVLLGEPYHTEAEARDASSKWLNALKIALSSHKIGADFGDRARKSGFTDAGLEALEAAYGGKILNDVHGVMIFQPERGQRFAVKSLSEHTPMPARSVVESIRMMHGQGAEMTPVEHLAYDIFSASFFQPSADARFLLLMMAVEVLIKPKARSAEVQDHVHAMIASTDASGLPANEVKSLTSSLKWLLDQSIGQAGRALARTLVPLSYMDMAPDQFFTCCYSLRSKLVHGHDPLPTPEEVDSHAAQLAIFVSDLLAGPLRRSVVGS